MSWWLSKPVQEFLDRQLGRDPASLGRPLQVMERQPPLSRNERALECLIPAGVKADSFGVLKRAGV
jgi:hypothetical protein